MPEHVAVLGAGLLGTATALLLARHGYWVTVYEARSAPMQEASRWNEGKIHLGYLYAADGSLGTAHQVLTGGLAFRPILESLIEESLEGHITNHDDLYLIHRDSVVGLDEVQIYFHRLNQVIRHHEKESNSYLCDLSRLQVQFLGRPELDELRLPDVIHGGLYSPERSVDTVWVADRLAAALAAEPRVFVEGNRRVTSVGPVSADQGPWRVSADGFCEGPFDWVVNALWQGRLAVDAAAGLPILPGWSHRYRLSVFLSTRHVHTCASAVVGFGPFGDIKNYDGRHFYLSWYPAGLTTESEELIPPAPHDVDPQSIVTATRAGLGVLLPWVDTLFADADAVQVRGGWVFAQGRGSLSDPSATLHRRDRFGIHRRGHYLSVDTGKYSSAPLLASHICRMLVDA